MKAKATRQAAPQSLEPVQDGARGKYLAKARNEYACRKLRNEALQLPIFGEPAWDILLWLYAHENEDRVGLAALAERAGAPISTTGRWLDYLVTEELVIRASSDHPSLTLTLTDRAAAMMDRYFARQLSGGQ
jgi:hypothetical protein